MDANTELNHTNLELGKYKYASAEKQLGKLIAFLNVCHYLWEIKCHQATVDQGTH